MELSPGLPTAPPCADLENAGPRKTTIASSPKGDRPVAADADRFSVTTKLTLAVAVTALGVGGTPRRASPALCRSAKSSGKWRAAGGPGEGRQVSAHSGLPSAPKLSEKKMSRCREGKLQREKLHFSAGLRARCLALMAPFVCPKS